MGREGGAIPSILVAPEVVLLSIFVLVSRGALFLCNGESTRNASLSRLVLLSLGKLVLLSVGRLVLL